MRTDPTLTPLLFLDFDGVLHPNGAVHPKLFDGTNALIVVLDEYRELEVVISSSWRFHHEWHELLGLLPERLAARVTGCTGAARAGKFQRHREITEFVRLRGTSHGPDRPWRAFDDAAWEFQPSCAELIACDGALGLEGEQLEALQLWLEQLRSCRKALCIQQPITRPELIEAANRVLADAKDLGVALLQRALRIGHNEALALLGNYLRSTRGTPSDT